MAMDLSEAVSISALLIPSVASGSCLLDLAMCSLCAILPLFRMLSSRFHVFRCSCLSLQPDFLEEAVVPLANMPFGEVGRTYVVLARPEGSLALGKFSCTLRFTVKEIDPSTGEDVLLDHGLCCTKC